MKTYHFVLLFLMFVIVSGCPRNKLPEEYRYGKFSGSPVNLELLNTAYNDFNSVLPVIVNHYEFHFSSDRNSYGENFDITGQGLNIIWDQEFGTLDIVKAASDYDTNLYHLFNMINTGNNEFGPYEFGYEYWQDPDTVVNRHLLIYSSGTDTSGFDSKIAWFDRMPYNGVTNYYGPFDIKLINSEFDDQYISFYGKDFVTLSYDYENFKKIEQMYFCSNRTGNYDIFKVDKPQEMDIVDYLTQDTVLIPEKISSLSSSFDDKCPFVNGNLMVFTSDREGGFGGYDLYYSKYENGEWSSPVNFGDGINTESDEYRPITVYLDGFVNTLMIFSSNRPGGHGGFDLYYVGIPQKVK